MLPDQAKKCVNPALKAHPQPKRSKRAPKPLRKVSKCHQVKKIFTALKAKLSTKQAIWLVK